MASASATVDIGQVDGRKDLNIKSHSGKTWQLHKVVHLKYFSVTFELPQGQNPNGYEALQLEDSMKPCIDKLVAYINKINFGEQSYHDIARGYVSLHDSQYLLNTKENLSLVDQAFGSWIQSRGPDLDLVRGVLAASLSGGQSILPQRWSQLMSQCIVEIVLHHPEAATQKWDALVADYSHGPHGQLMGNAEMEIQRRKQQRTNRDLAREDCSRREGSDADDEDSGSGGS